MILFFLLMSFAFAAPEAPNHEVQQALKQGNLLALHKLLTDESKEVRRQAIEAFATLAQQENRKADFENFERLRGKEAEKLLESAAEKGGLPALENIARNYFPTKAGAQAAALLVRHHFNQNRERTKGSEAADLLRASYWGKDLPPAEGILMAYVYLRASRFKDAKREIALLETQKDQTLRFGKSECPVGPIADHLAKLADELTPIPLQTHDNGSLLGVTDDGTLLIGYLDLIRSWQKGAKWVTDTFQSEDLFMTNKGVVLLHQLNQSLEWHFNGPALANTDIVGKIISIGVDPEAPLGTAVVTTPHHLYWIKEGKITADHKIAEYHLPIGCVSGSFTSRAFWESRFQTGCASSDFAIQTPEEVQILREGKVIERIPARHTEMLAKIANEKYVLLELTKEERKLSWYEKGIRVGQKIDPMRRGGGVFKVFTHPSGRVAIVRSGIKFDTVIDVFFEGKYTPIEIPFNWSLPMGYFLQDGSLLLNDSRGNNALYDKDGTLNQETLLGTILGVRQDKNGKTQISVTDPTGRSALYEDSKRGLIRAFPVSLPTGSPIHSTEDGTLIYQSKQTGKIIREKANHPLLALPQFPCLKEGAKKSAPPEKPHQ